MTQSICVAGGEGRRVREASKGGTSKYGSDHRMGKHTLLGTSWLHLPLIVTRSICVAGGER